MKGFPHWRLDDSIDVPNQRNHPTHIQRISEEKIRVRQASPEIIGRKFYGAINESFSGRSRDNHKSSGFSHSLSYCSILFTSDYNYRLSIRGARMMRF